MRKLIGLLIVGALLSIGQVASAGPLEDGLAAAKRGDHATALKLFRPLAEQGDVVAQSMLGSFYWSGVGVRQDYAESMKWYLKAAEQGDAMAQYGVAIMHDNGQGVRQNYQRAMSWYQRAADQNLDAAKINLGIMFGRGQGVKRDLVRAYMWLDLAASGPWAESEPETRELAVKNRDLFAREMTPTQIATGQRLAREWKPKYEK